MTPVFLGSARCFHTADWFNSCKKISPTEPIFITDSLSGDGLKFELSEADNLVKLVVIDKLFFSKPSSIGDKWRNLLKLLIIPIQILFLRVRLGRIADPVIFAHSTYYAFLASFTGYKYIATPQGSEVIVRPVRSRFYRLFLKRSVSKAFAVTVDSIGMSEALLRIASVKPVIIQNGIDIDKIREFEIKERRNELVSIRAISSNYQIVELLRERNSANLGCSLKLVAPFYESNYKLQVESLLRSRDQYLGRLDRIELYELLLSSICVVSIPISDSSPRSVYESIFCGAIVISVDNEYINALPLCMRERIIVVDISDSGWLTRAMLEARDLAKRPYTPSNEALNRFDQRKSMQAMLDLAAVPAQQIR